jgi:hypothetical protein
MGFTAANTVADTNLQPPRGGGQKSRGRAGFVIAGGVLALAAIAVAVIILVNRGSGSSTASADATNAATTYEHQLDKLLTPLVTANQQVSTALTGLNGNSQATNTAKTQATAAIAALGSVKGGLTVLNPPASASTLSGQVQQALSADSGYLQAVSQTLDTPTGNGSGQLQTLSTGAQTAMVNLNPVVSSASASITGTSNLVGWAQGAQHAARAASKKAQARAAKKAAATHSSSSSSSSGSSSPPAVAQPPAQSNPTPTPSSGTSSCDQNISVDASTTTCGFADSVFAAYASQVQAEGEPLSTTVSASSATTGQTYQDYCAYDSSSGMVSCSHGTDLIQFPEWAAAAY